MILDLINTNDGTMYHVVRKIPEHVQIDTEHFKNKTNSTHVFRKDGLFWFVRIIEEAQLIEEEEQLLEENLEEQ